MEQNQFYHLQNGNCRRTRSLISLPLNPLLILLKAMPFISLKLSPTSVDPGVLPLLGDDETLCCLFQIHLSNQQ